MLFYFYFSLVRFYLILYFAHIHDQSSITDDVTNLVAHGILNTNL